MKTAHEQIKTPTSQIKSTAEVINGQNSDKIIADSVVAYNNLISQTNQDAAVLIETALNLFEGILNKGKIKDTIKTLRVFSEQVAKNGTEKSIMNNEEVLREKSAFPPALAVATNLAANILNASNKPDSNVKLNSEEEKSLQAIYGLFIKASGKYGFDIPAFKNTGIYKDESEKQIGRPSTYPDFNVSATGCLVLAATKPILHASSLNYFKDRQTELKGFYTALELNTISYQSDEVQK
jgi:hypothetical protein